MSMAWREEGRIGFDQVRFHYYLGGELCFVLGTAHKRSFARHDEPRVFARRGAACRFLTVPWRVRAIDGAPRRILHLAARILVYAHWRIAHRRRASPLVHSRGLLCGDSAVNTGALDGCASLFLLYSFVCLFFYIFIYLLVYAVPSHHCPIFIFMRCPSSLFIFSV